MDGGPRKTVGTPTLDISSVVAAFSEEQAARVTGLSKRQLRYWATTDFFKPSFVEDNPRLPNSRFYSFKDMVALRTLERLRVQNNVPLQHLRKVAENLSHLKDELWTATTLYVLNRRVILVNSETDQPEEVVSGQFVLGIPLRDIINETRDSVAELCQRSPDSIGKLRKHRSIVRNAWSVSGTRIAVESIRRLHEDGYSVDRIIAEYPDLTPEDIDAALHHDESKAA
ncbi:MAG: DUF433 domain-containing protein [Rhodospirillaceae bacterium]|nr:DUF433 domain-containing protein [Rhodospirillaceae bacterium]MCY4067336.1 DUF433 domain-containing protein [Rhodospirillaceae bacterium]